MILLINTENISTVIIITIIISSLYSGRQRLDILFHVNIFKSKIRTLCILDAVILRVATRLIRDYPLFNSHHRHALLSR
jgi:hypothetical protein